MIRPQTKKKERIVKMSSTKTPESVRPINRDYFKAVIKNSGLTQKAFAESVGRTKSFAYNTLNRGQASDPVIRLICKTYGADYNRMTTVAHEPCAGDDPVKRLDDRLTKIESKLDKLLSLWEG